MRLPLPCPAGTLRDFEASEAARAAEGGSGDLYVLPDAMKAKAEAQYARDVAAVHGEAAGREMESEYKNFMQELGGDVPRWVAQRAGCSCFSARAPSVRAP